MRNLIIRFCFWIINKLQQNNWVKVKILEDCTFEVYDKKERVFNSRDGNKWTLKASSVLILLSMCFVGCGTHKHCGTAHYSTATSQDFENMKRRGETNELLLNREVFNHD